MTNWTGITDKDQIDMLLDDTELHIDCGHFHDTPDCPTTPCDDHRCCTQY